MESIEVYAPLANRLGMGKLKGELEDAAFPMLTPKNPSKHKADKRQTRFLRKNLTDVQKNWKKN